MKKYSFLISLILLVSCSKKEVFFPLNNLDQIDGFWKASSNLIYIDSKDSTLTFNKLKKHKLIGGRHKRTNKKNPPII